MLCKIQTAQLDWDTVDGIDIPISKQFGDVYFSKANGLRETQHVFLNGNDLEDRLSQLQPFQNFYVAETGFGTGLNILALWQLWQKTRPDNHSHLHVMSVEKYPLTKEDLTRALHAWPELSHLSVQLIKQYPLAIAGCHRLSFDNERFSIDLWLGDAQEILPSIIKNKAVDAWFLDGFAPSCNPELWEENILQHIIRLSDYGTSFASFSVAGVLKRGLKQYGIDISRPKGFGRKREMLKAIWREPETTDHNTQNQNTQSQISSLIAHSSQPRNIAVIGAGIAGLSTAWAFAKRGHKVAIFEQNAPLSEASGNPLALLNPKLCPIEQSSGHLMTLSWQYALQFYAPFKAFRPITVHQIAQKNSDELLALAEQYPEHVLQAQNVPQQIPLHQPYLSLNIAGAVAPHHLKDEILAHPNITLHIAKIDRCESVLTKDSLQPVIHLFEQEQCLFKADTAIVCAARHSQLLFARYPKLKPIRGQVSWLNNSPHALSMHHAYSYGGYCMQLNEKDFILGASFSPNREDEQVLYEDHVHNFDLIHSISPEYAQTLPDIHTWQGRASIRAQTMDYLPLLGRIDSNSQIFTFSGLGSKGFLFAPLCSEILAAMALNEAYPIAQPLLDQLNPQRFFKKEKVRKPYYRPAQEPDAQH